MNKTVKILLAIGGILSPLLIGTLVTVQSIVMAFHDLQAKDISDPNQLATRMALALTATFVGMIVSAALLVLFLIYRAFKPKYSSP